MVFAEDLAVFFNPEEFAIHAVIGGNKVAGLFSHAFILVNDVETRKPVFTCAESQLTGISKETHIKIQQQSYQIISIKPDGTDIVILVLEQVI
jgi:hypothetical protein